MFGFGNRKERVTTVTKVTVRVACTINLGNFQNWKQDITAEVEIGSDDDVKKVIKDTQLMLCKSLINQEQAILVCCKVASYHIQRPLPPCQECDGSWWGFFIEEKHSQGEYYERER